MDFALNEIQQELKEQARGWLASRYPLDRDWDAPQDDRWSELEELGWLDVAAADLGFVEEALLVEEMGYALYPGPYLAHVTGQNEVFGSGGTIGTVDPTRPLHPPPNGPARPPASRTGRPRRRACAPRWRPRRWALRSGRSTSASSMRRRACSSASRSAPIKRC